MRGRHVSFCCKCYQKPPAKTHALETEGLKKQLAQSYALLHFMSQRRKIHTNPQTDNEMTNTAQFIEHLKKLLGMNNQATPSIPQQQATQTDPANPENPQPPKYPEAPESEEDETSSQSTDAYMDAGREIAYTYLYFQDPSQDLDALAEKVGAMSQEELEEIAEVAMKSDFESDIKDISAEIKKKEPQSYDELVKDLNILLTNR